MDEEVLSSLKRKREAIPFSDFVEESKQEDAIPSLSYDVLRIIFLYATSGGKERKPLCRIREVSREWSLVIDTAVIKACWERLGQDIKHPILRALVDRFFLADNFVTRVLSSALRSSADEPDEDEDRYWLERAKALGPTYFFRFSNLTQELRKSGAPIPSHCAVLSFGSHCYDAMQQSLDKSLAAVWTRIRREIKFKQAPIPRGAQEIRQWFKDPINAEKIAGINQLDLSRLVLPALPVEIGQFTRLTKLDLYNGDLTILPDAIGQLTRLTKLKLSFNTVTSCPDTIGNLIRLKKLNFSYNLLMGLPDTIGHLIQLTRLDLSHNSLKSLPDVVCKLVQLRQLILSQNQFPSLPDSIGNLTQLTRLDLYSSQLTTLPDTIGKIAGLKKLNLSSSKLTSLPDTVSNLTLLTMLNLSGNPQLTSIPIAIYNFPCLRKFYYDQVTTPGHLHSLW